MPKTMSKATSQFKTFPDFETAEFSAEAKKAFAKYEKEGSPLVTVSLPKATDPLLECFGLVSAHKHRGGMWIYDKMSFESKPFTVMFKIPQLGDIRTNRDSNELFGKYRQFFQKWYLMETGKEEPAKMMKIFERYSVAFAVISIPGFASGDLVKDLKDMNAEYTVISPDFKIIECPMCGATVETEKQTKVVTCHKCGRNFTG